jgi:hypothetical protein
MDDLNQSDEEFADQLRERARAFLARVADDPDGALDDDSEEGPSLQSLQGIDRAAAIDALTKCMMAIASANGWVELKPAIATFQQVIVPWLWTAEEWEYNPAIERLTSPLSGDGPRLEAEPHRNDEPQAAASSTETGWILRAVDVRTARQWNVVASKLREAVNRLHQRLATGEFGTDTFCRPLRGQIGKVAIGGKLLDHLEARGQAAIRRGRGTKKDRTRFVAVSVHKGFAALMGEARILYAVDRAEMTVWITDATLFKLDPRSGRWVYSPADESKSTVPHSRRGSE